MPSTSEKRRAFRALHQEGCFVMPNPFDVGSAIYLQTLGFNSLATTSAGAAWGLGVADDNVPRDPMLAHITALVAATDLPVNADYGNGFADEPEGVADNVRRCIETGVAGLSIEDMTGDPARPLYETGLAVERIRAARAAIDAAGGETLLVARSEAYRVLDRAEGAKVARQRLELFAEAGADCLFAPWVPSREDIAALVRAVAPKPLNIVMGDASYSVADLAALGVRRVSVGGALARVAWGAVMNAAREIAEKGTFEAFGQAASFAGLNRLFAGRSTG